MARSICSTSGRTRRSARGSVKGVSFRHRVPRRSRRGSSSEMPVGGTAGRSGVSAVGLLVVWMVACKPAFGLNPGLDLAQYAHTSLKNREGTIKGTVNTIIQTADGYLWVGTDCGLLRFDGVRFVAWQPPGQRLPSDTINSLLAARAGTIWVGTEKGLASWKNNTLTQYPQLAGSRVSRLLEDRENAVWVGVWDFPPPGRLCVIRNGTVRCHGEDGSLGYGVLGLFEDRGGHVWAAGGAAGIWHWKPGPPRFYRMDAPTGIRGFIDDVGGALLVASPGGLRRCAEGRFEPYPIPGVRGRFRAQHILRDRDGALWIGTYGDGLVHVHQGRTDVLTRLGGLSGDRVHDLFEDREGNVWVLTDSGLDWFRDLAVVT